MDFSNYIFEDHNILTQLMGRKCGNFYTSQKSQRE